MSSRHCKRLVLPPHPRPLSRGGERGGQVLILGGVLAVNAFDWNELSVAREKYR